MMSGGGGIGGQIADWIKSAADDTKRDQLTLYNMYDANRRENTRHDEWQTQMNVNTDMYLNRYTHSVADLRRAGLNPMLAVTQGQPPASGGNVGTSAPHSAGAVNNQRGSSLSLAASAQAASQASLVNAQAEKLAAEARNLDASTDKLKEEAPLARQHVQESIQRAKTLLAQESREYASADQSRQAVVNMQAELPRIEATTTQLRALTQEALQGAGLKEAQARHVMQQVNQNLPELERALAEFRVKLEGLKVPGGQNAAMAQESFVGVLGAYIKALLPLDSFMGTIPLGKAAPTINRGPTIINK